MRPHRWIVWFLASLATLGGERLLADDVRMPLAEPGPWQAPVFRVGHWETQPAPPAIRLAHWDPEIVEPDALAEPQISEPEIGDLSEPVSPPRPLHGASVLSLNDLERIAMESNPTLAQARMVVRAAQGRYLQARLYPNPTIGYLGDDLGIGGTVGVHGMAVGQEIITNGKRRLARAVAGHEVVQAQAAWAAQQYRVLNDVRAGYHDVLLAQKTLEVNEQLVRIGLEGLKVTEQLQAAQEVSRAEVLQARIEAEHTKLSLAEAQNHHRVAWRRLVAMLGRPDMEPAPVVGDLAKELPVLGWEETFDRLLAESPELAEARAGVERARCELALQCAERRPNLEIEAAAKYDFSDVRGLVDVAIAVPLPLLNRNQGNIVSAQADLVGAEHDVRRLELELRDRFAVAFEQYANARIRVETYSGKILPDAKASLDLVSAGYSEGEFGYLALLTAQRTYFSANLDYLSSLWELWARIVELEGMLLSGGLERPE